MRQKAEGVGPYEHLAAAIIYQAVRDAREGDTEALDWLNGDECRAYCDYIGMDWLIVQRWTQKRGAGSASRLPAGETAMAGIGDV